MPARWYDGTKPVSTPSVTADGGHIAQETTDADAFLLSLDGLTTDVEMARRQYVGWTPSGGNGFRKG